MRILNRLYMQWIALWARAYVRVAGAFREPSWMITEVVLPVLSMTAYVYIYRAFGAPKEYEGLVVVGGAMIPYWLTVLWAMAAQFYWEKEVGNLDLFMVSPMNAISLLMGMALGGAFMASVRTVIIFLVGVLFFHVTFQVQSPGLIVLIFLLTMTALFSLGMTASSAYFMFGRAGIKINTVLMEPVFLFSGLYFPVRNLGPILGMIGALIPLTLGLDGIRQLVLPSGKAMGFIAPWIEAAILAGMTLVFSGTAVFFMRFMERMGKREGRMTLRWQ